MPGLDGVVVVAVALDAAAPGGGVRAGRIDEVVGFEGGDIATLGGLIPGGIPGGDDFIVNDGGGIPGGASFKDDEGIPCDMGFIDGRMPNAIGFMEEGIPD